MAYSLFSCFGIEPEYMLVNQKSLNVVPLSDQLIASVHGQITSEFERGALCWSNELVAHAIEFKTNGPASSLSGLADQFHHDVRTANQALNKLGAQLMPTAMHPWMNPLQESQLWAHDYNEVYEAYDRIFGCQGHGWSNVQSVHINLPFANDDEFARLHAAIRLVLPLIPALAASSPFADAKYANALDARLLFYESNQKIVPLICNGIIPEVIRSQAQYKAEMFQPIYEAIKPYDRDQILQNEWLNSRGAIARFERMAIEIRIQDIQECPRADLACAGFIVALLKKLVAQDQFFDLPSTELKALLDRTTAKGPRARIENPSYLQVFGQEANLQTMGDLLRFLKNEWLDCNDLDHSALNHILDQGPLAHRLVTRLGTQPSRLQLEDVYRQLCHCLEENKQFAV